jgi:hypothetical protein
VVIEEGEEVQDKGIGNIFNKIIAENVQNLKKEILVQMQEASRTPNRHDQSRTYPWHGIIKTISIENKKRTLKAVRVKPQITYKVKPNKKQISEPKKQERHGVRYFEH